MRGPRVGFQTFFKIAVKSSRRSPRPKRRAAAALECKQLQMLAIFHWRPPLPVPFRESEKMPQGCGTINPVA